MDTPGRMLILGDDGCIHVYESAAGVVFDIEALDAESCIRRVFDSRGVPYRIEWITPNRVGRKVFGMQSVENGEYNLVPAGDAQPDQLLEMLSAAGNGVFPATAAPFVEALKDALRGAR